MKLNRGLVIISMVIISLLAVGAVSASENVSGVIETADFDDVVTVEDNLEDSVAIEDVPEDVVTVENNTGNSEILSVESEKDPVAVNSGENEIVKLNSSSLFNWSSIFNNNGSLFNLNLSSLSDSLNLTSLVDGLNLSSLLDNLNLSSLLDNFNWTNLFGGNGTSIFNNSVSNIINNIINWITGNNTNTSEVPDYYIKSVNLKTYYDKYTTFNVTVMNGNKPVTEGKVVFVVNNKKYTRSVDSNGVAVLKIKLKPGSYYVTSAYGNISAIKKITVKKSILAKDVTQKYNKAGKFTVKILNSKGKAQTNQLVKITLKGKTYSAKTNKNGVVTFKLPKTLKIGTHTVKTTCKGLTISNKITVKK